MPRKTLEGRRQYNKEWRLKNQDRLRQHSIENRIDLSAKRMQYYHANGDHERKRQRMYYQEVREKLLARKRDEIRNLRAAAIAKLGGRCANTECRYLNLDGTLGCNDVFVLQIDHVFNDGAEERKTRTSLHSFYKQVVCDDSGRFQLLCPTCNSRKQLLQQIKG